MNIDPEFLDVDFEKDPHFIFGDRGMRCFGAKKFGDEITSIEQSQWPELIEKMEGGWLELLVKHIYDQGQEGSCVGNATAQAVNVIQASQIGKDASVLISPMSIYAFIGQSPSSGAIVSDAMDFISQHGCLPLDTPGYAALYAHVLPATGYHRAREQFRKWGDSWKATAAQFRGVEFFQIDRYSELVSASLLGFPVVVGRQGHSICYLRPLLAAGKIKFLYANSWGQWGQAAGDLPYGFGIDSSTLVQDSASWAFAIRAVI